MKLGKTMIVAGCALFANFAEAEANPSPMRDASRGELLYANHCIACHSVAIHWRDKKRVTDLASLQVQVKRWQGLAGLGWDADDLAQVTCYLNALHYHYSRPSGPDRTNDGC